jgi:NAD(P)-dependent dehydrogenase (short-subunit alcohol dehydrogenase family)
MTPLASRGAVLITGCSSGIGRATALELARSGRPVYATARRPDTLAALKRAGCRILPLDVTDEESMRAAVGVVESEHGAVGALVNNAGYAVYGPVEQVPIDDVRKQFETNVFGLARLTQLVLPAMRERKSGTIVNVSSMGGRITLPGGAFYHASKYALEAISNALRFEVEPFGIAVVVVEPGPVDTPWNDVAAGSLDAASANSDTGADPYATFKAAVARAFHTASHGTLARQMSSTPEDVGRVIARAIDSRRPRTRYLVGGTARALVTLEAVLPDRLYDAALRRQYGLS